MRSNQVRAMLATLHGRPYERAEAQDAAYWVKGCSSLGRLRYAVLMGCGEDAERGAGLIDIKEAVAAACPSAAAVAGDHALRVVEGARSLSPFIGGRMAIGRLLGRPVFIRELLPQDLNLELERLGQAQTVAVGDYLGWVIGLAHARQLDAASRSQWGKEVRRSSLETPGPSWLWTSVAALIVEQQGAYLEHCRGVIGPQPRHRGRSSAKPHGRRPPPEPPGDGQESRPKQPPPRGCLMTRRRRCQAALALSSWQ